MGSEAAGVVQEPFAGGAPGIALYLGGADRGEEGLFPASRNAALARAAEGALSAARGAGGRNEAQGL